MTTRKQIEEFNHHLDALLRGDETDPGALSDADRQALDIARRLTALELSMQSELRHSLRRKLAQNARLLPQATLRFSRKPSLQPLAALTLAVPGAALVFVLVFVLGWTLTNLSGSPASGSPVSATAFALPGAAMESGSPIGENSPDMQAIAPQPLPTPIAPRQFTTALPSTISPDQTPSQISPRSGSTGFTQAKP